MQLKIKNKTEIVMSNKNKAVFSDSILSKDLICNIKLSNFCESFIRDITGEIIIIDNASLMALIIIRKKEINNPFLDFLERYLHNLGIVNNALFTSIINFLKFTIK